MALAANGNVFYSEKKAAYIEERQRENQEENWMRLSSPLMINDVYIIFNDKEPFNFFLYASYVTRDF